jgi:hypothetical protein
MRQSRLIGGVRRAIVVGGAVLGVALVMRWWRECGRPGRVEKPIE